MAKDIMGKIIKDRIMRTVGEMFIEKEEKKKNYFTFVNK